MNFKINQKLLKFKSIKAEKKVTKLESKIFILEYKFICPNWFYHEFTKLYEEYK